MRSASLGALVCVVLGAALCWPGASAAQGRSGSSEAELLRIRAQKTTAPIRVDGRLDESAWQDADVAGQFRQVEPNPRDSARFPTLVRVLFDQGNLYVGVMAYDSAGQRGARESTLT